MKRTDLAVEIISDKDIKGIKSVTEIADGITTTKITVPRSAEKLIGKSAGRYFTVHCGAHLEKKELLGEILAHYLSEMLKSLTFWEPVMVVGFGNADITPDSLGAFCVKKIPATAHLAREKQFAELGLRPVTVISTGVLAKTGIESADQMKSIAENVLPSALIVIDSLACAEAERLAATIQITDAGIALGSGVGNNRKRVSQKEYGVPVIAIGVPTVIDYDEGNFMVTPRNIDGLIKIYSDIIATGINRFTNPTLSNEEINELLF